ncbi:MAG: AraC family transcriptional regulator [Verrucomicrobia bacterium]|nr:AraC family transcriptional regulator [Verrucomicrobiota bacterium]MBM3889875.1 AraC family transcriptional regulator [Verrucomicrobiota bacterium]
MSQTPASRIETIAQSLQLAELFEPFEDVQFWIKDREGRYCRINRAFLLNYALTEPSQVIGKTDYDLSPAFLADQFRFDDEQVLDGQRVVNRIERVGQAGQTASWNVTNKIPIRDAHGRIIGTAGTTRQLGAEARELIGAHGFEPVVAHIRDHYREHISNRQLAALAHMSVRAFERKFHDNFHVTPQQYIRKLRVRIACRALVYTEKPLAEVALECGFADQSHFAREFRHQTRQTPREYREHYRRL